MPRPLPFALVVLLAALPLVGQYSQYPRYNPTYGGGRSNERVKADRDAKSALPTFTGIVRGSAAKGLTVEADDGNLVAFKCTKKTAYLDGKRKLKATDLKPGDYVSVEARMTLDASLEAVNVQKQDKSLEPATKDPDDDAPRKSGTSRPD